ncbi:MAG: DUF429 domain-containing protein, partial [Acidimicrobiales bacterium]
PRVAAATVAVGPAAGDEIVELCRGASALGIDAPDAPTGGCPLPGIRPARCAEVALAASAHGLDRRMVGGPLRMLTPSIGAPFPARLEWMKAGFALWGQLRLHLDGVHLFETWPSGTFTRLAAGAERPVRLLPRSSPGGVAQRARLLSAVVDGPPFLDLWGLDGLDALAAALAAYRVATGGGYVVAAHDHVAHDGSSITLVR